MHFHASAEGAAHGQRHRDGRGQGNGNGSGDGHGHAGGRRRLRWVLGLTAAFMVAELVGGLLSGSLALLADAGHMFTDVAALALSLLAMAWARRPTTPERTYGWVRLEILAALVNGATLLLIAGWVIVEAVGRLREPVAVDAPLMLGVAAAGLVANAVGLLLLHGHSRHDLNVRGAYLHVLGDLLGSVGALTAGVVIALTGWSAADPIASIAIALLILASAGRLVREAADVLLEAAPRHVDVERVLQDLGAIPGLADVHDLHVWTLTSGFIALSGHGVLAEPGAHGRVLDDVRRRAARHGIGHVTFQLEPPAFVSLRADSRGDAE
jgi:cobalt-zinc-cadmium efflux system protein